MAREVDLGRRSLDRRSFLRRGGVAGAGAVLLAGGGMSALLAACSSSSTPAASDTTPTLPGETPDYGDLAFQLSWMKNVEFAGEYIADTNGYFVGGGFSSVKLVSGGPSVQQDLAVAAGQAFVCISAPAVTAKAINNGAELITIGAQYQRSPFAVMSLSSNPINTPQDMVGKKIGVQATNDAVWNTFLEVNKIDPSTIDKTVVQSDPQPLIAQEVDGWLSFATNEPNLLEAQGVETATFLLADYKYPLVSNTYVVKRSDVTANRDKVKAMLVADIMGWRENIKDPTLGAKLAADKYGKDQNLTVAEQTVASTAGNALMLTDDTKANGLFTISDRLIDRNIEALGRAGINIAKDKLFDVSVIKELYEENPDLKVNPAKR